VNEWLAEESIALEWMPIDRPLDADEYADDRVQQWTHLGIKVAVHTVQQGGATNYPSQLARQSELIRGDIVGSLTERYRAADALEDGDVGHAQLRVSGKLLNRDVGVGIEQYDRSFEKHYRRLRVLQHTNAVTLTKFCVV
jgi:hypothetical protein